MCLHAVLLFARRSRSRSECVPIGDGLDSLPVVWCVWSCVCACDIVLLTEPYVLIRYTAHQPGSYDGDESSRERGES